MLAHESIYVAPTHDYVPLVYPPVYYYVAALAARVLGSGFLPPEQYADGSAVTDLMLGGSAEVRGAFVDGLRPAICGAAEGTTVLMDAALLAPELGIAGVDGHVDCRP